MKALLRFIAYLKKYKLRIFLGLIFVIIANLTSAFIPRLIGNIIDIIISGNFEQSLIISKIAEIVGLTLISGLFMFLTRQTIIVASRFIEYDMRRDLLLAIQNQPLQFFSENPTGSLMAHITNDITSAREFLGPALMYSANTLATFIFVVYFMLDINPLVTLTAVSPLPLIAIATYFIGRKVYSSFKDVQEQFARLTAQSQESFSGIGVIKTYVKESYEEGIFKKMSNEYLNKNLLLSKIQALSMPLITVLVGISVILVLFVGGIQVISKVMTLGELTQFFIYLSMLIWPVAAIGWITNLVQRATASANRLGIIFEKIPEQLDTEKTDYNIKNIVGEIRFENVEFEYPSSKRKIVNNLNFQIPEGSVIAIVGAVGSGKSSIVSLLLRLYEASSGRILIDNREISEIPIELLRQEMSVSPQDIFLFSDTINENIRIAKPDATIEEIMNICKLVRIDSEIQNFPQKYETIIGERGVTLSGGQKQRLSIARALIKQPKILILDDTFSAIDIENEAKIMKGILSINPKPTVILISHRIYSIKYADMIIFIENGEVIEYGTHNELVQLKGKYFEMYNKQILEKEIEEYKF